jgi:phosphoglycolate phosphatase-like HAD superfamily hydrolase
VITNLIWDVDGTLFDTYPSIVEAYVQAIGAYGLQADPARVEALCLQSLSFCARQMAADLGLEAPRLERDFADRYAAIPAQAQPPFYGVSTVCEAILARGGVNAIATHRRRESTLGLLSAHGMSHLFAQIVAADDGLPKKPDPSSFARLLVSLALDSTHTGAVGDREIDILAGQAAGLRTFLFRGHAGSSHPDFTFTRYAQLLHHLAS